MQIRQEFMRIKREISQERTQARPKTSRIDQINQLKNQFFNEQGQRKDQKQSYLPNDHINNQNYTNLNPHHLENYKNQGIINNNNNLQSKNYPINYQFNIPSQPQQTISSRTEQLRSQIRRELNVFDQVKSQNNSPTRDNRQFNCRLETKVFSQERPQYIEYGNQKCPSQVSIIGRDYNILQQNDKDMQRNYYKNDKQSSYLASNFKDYQKDKNKERQQCWSKSPNRVKELLQSPTFQFKNYKQSTQQASPINRQEQHDSLYETKLYTKSPFNYESSKNESLNKLGNLKSTYFASNQNSNLKDLKTSIYPKSPQIGLNTVKLIEIEILRVDATLNQNLCQMIRIQINHEQDDLEQCLNIDLPKQTIFDLDNQMFDSKRKTSGVLFLKNTLQLKTHTHKALEIKIRIIQPSKLKGKSVNIVKNNQQQKEIIQENSKEVVFTEVYKFKLIQSQRKQMPAVKLTVINFKVLPSPRKPIII
eukprot:403370899